MPAAKPTPSVKSTTSKLPVVFLVLTVAILAAGGYYVYSTFKKPGAPLSNPLEMAKQVVSGNGMIKVSENDFKDINDPLIRKHLAAQINIGKYRIRSTSDGMDTNSEQMMEFVVSGSDVHYHMMQKMGGKSTVDMIVIGDTTYLKDMKDNSWWKQTAKPEKTSPTAEKIEEKYKPEDFKTEYTSKTGTEYKKLGEEACGSLACYKYQEIDSTSPEVHRTFWFDKDQLLLRKEVNGQGEFTSTQEYSYDNLNINAPSPTKEVPEGKSIYDYMISGMMGGQEPAGMPGAGAGQMKIKPEDAERMMQQYQNDYAPDDTPADVPENY